MRSGQGGPLPGSTEPRVHLSLAVGAEGSMPELQLRALGCHKFSRGIQRRISPPPGWDWAPRGRAMPPWQPTPLQSEQNKGKVHLALGINPGLCLRFSAIMGCLKSTLTPGTTALIGIVSKGRLFN